MRFAVGTLIDEQNAKWKADENFAIGTNIDRIDSGFREAETLQVHHDVTGEERDVFRELDFEFRLDRHVVRVERIAVLVDDVDRKLVAASVFWREAKAQRERAGRMHDGHRAGGEGVESSRDDELAVIIGGEVAKSGDLNVHGV